MTWGDSTRDVPGDPPGQAGLESAAIGDLDDDGDLDVLVGQPVNSLSARVDSIHYFLWDPAGSGGLEQVAHTLPSTPGVDAVAIADVDADGCNDVVAAGTYGTRDGAPRRRRRAASTAARTCHRSATGTRPPPRA